MAFRTFKYFSIAAGGTVQALVGTASTAAVAAGSNVSIPVSDSSMFLKGDYAAVDTGANQERPRVTSVPDGTHVVVDNLSAGHASGVSVRPSLMVNSVYVQSNDGNTGALFVGNNPALVKATGVGVLKKVLFVAANSIPPDFSTADLGGFSNPVDLADFWIDGTTSDKYLPSVTVV